MQTRRWVVLMSVAGTAALLGLAGLSAVRAQEDPPRKAKIIIQTPEGEHEFELDLSQLSPLGDGNQVLMMQGGPDVHVMTFAGGPNMLGMLKGMNGFEFLGPSGMAMLKGMEIIDPGRNYISYLIKREDVLANLYITPTQRAALEALDKNQQTVLQQQVKAGMLPGHDDLKGKSPQELLDLFTERARKMQEQMQSFVYDRDKQVASILTPKQMTRLQELDRQWRGPLAMGVKEVAEQARLTPEQKPTVADLLKTYQQDVSKRLNDGMRPFGFSKKPGTPAPSARNENPPPPTTPAEMQAKMEQACKEIEKARKALGDKALNALSSEQRAQWAALNGKPFPFRPDN